MNSFQIVKAFNRLGVTFLNTQRGIGTTIVKKFRITPYVMAEPLKKKKKLDPAVIKAREERKKKKIEKQIRRLEKNARQFKPIEECEVSLAVLDEKRSRLREVQSFPIEIQEKRVLLEKLWASYKKNQHLADLQILNRLAFLQQKALDELQLESGELYQKAMELDFHCLPFHHDGPLETPLIENYKSPDGDYIDVSRKWE